MKTWFAHLLTAGALLALGFDGAFAQDAVPASEKTTYLGIAMAELSDALRSHVSLPRGVGLVVAHVVPDSPAQKAGLEKYDIVRKLNDQIVVNPDQFSVLIKGMKPGETIRLGIIRQAKEKVIEVVLGETQNELGSNTLQAPFGTFGGQFRMGQGSRAQTTPCGNGQTAVVLTGTTSAVSSLSDGTHNITVTRSGNSRHIRATNAAGNVVFDGPVNTDAERDALPEEIRDKIGALEVQVGTIDATGPSPSKNVF